MKVFILTEDIENNEEDAILEGTSEYLKRMPIAQGIEIHSRDVLVPIEISIYEGSLRGKMPDLLIIEGAYAPIFSDRGIILFQNNKIDNLQFFPAIIKDEFSNADEVDLARLKKQELDFKSITYENYHIANVVGLLDCVDHQASNLEYYIPRKDIPEDMPVEMKKLLLEEQEDNDIDFIRKLVLVDTKIPEDIKIFRLKDCPRILVFKEEIVKAIREAKLTGFVFVPLGKYTDEIPDDDDDDDEAVETEKPLEKAAAEKTAKALLAEQPELPKVGGGIVIKRIRKSD